MSQAPSQPPLANDPTTAFIERFGQVRDKMLHELHKVIIGQDEVIGLLMAAIFARGHCLVVGVPGLAKTLLISTLARVLKLSFNRIQFTPDLMPADIVGSEVLEEADGGRRGFQIGRASCRERVWL